MRWTAPVKSAGFIPALLCLCLCVWGSGCHSTELGGHTWAPPKTHFDPDLPPPPADMPRELSRVLLPDYVIEIPDILLIDAVKVVPKPPYRIETLDVLSVQVEGTLPDRPVTGEVTVEPGGTINLGPPYGSVKVSGMDLAEAKQAIHDHLLNTLQEPEVLGLTLIQSAGAQQIAGEHIIGPDGMVTLGTYGKVFLTGMTQGQAKQAIEAHLSQFLESPEVAVDIYAYNSKSYYILMQNAGAGDGVVKVPIKGNETILDAVAEIQGLEDVSSKRIWIARPAPMGSACDQILPVDWYAITQRADTTTNYQILPNDRVFIAEDKWLVVNDRLSKFVAPFQRVFGGVLMGTFTTRAIWFFGRSTGGGFI